VAVVQGGQGVRHLRHQRACETEQPAAASRRFTTSQSNLRAHTLPPLRAGHPGVGLGLAFRKINSHSDLGLHSGDG